MFLLYLTQLVEEMHEITYLLCVKGMTGVEPVNGKMFFVKTL